MNFKKKGQFMIFSALFLFLLLYFIYSLETVNPYKFENGDFIHIQGYQDEICFPLTQRNGSTLNTSIQVIENSIDSYCVYTGDECFFDIYNITSIPPSGNWSLLNISQFRIRFDINRSDLQLSNDFACI